MSVTDAVNDPIVWRTILLGGFLLFLVPGLFYGFRYRSAIQRRLQGLEDDSSKGVMVRQKIGAARSTSKEIKCLELNPEFVELHKHQWRLLSLGQYLTSLRAQIPGDNDNSEVLPKFIERQLEVTIGTVLLRALGRRFGGAILPLLGLGNVNSKTGQLAAGVASWWASHFFVTEKNKESNHIVDAGTLPVDLNELIALANLNQKVFGSSRMEIKPLEWMRRGEVGYDPSFGKPLVAENKPDNDGEEDPELIPNPFIVSRHWEAAILGLERLVVTTSVVTGPAASPDAESTPGPTAYNPEDRSLPEPTLINARLLPDLHIGLGNAKCTHTKREIIRNRLVAVLLNKLSHNFYKKEQQDKDLFIVKMDEKSRENYYPQDFLKALMDSGHTVEMCPRSQITTFGIQFCIKESDGSWSYVPFGVFLRSGYERRDSQPSHYILPHGGMDLKITGPLVGRDATGRDRRCDIQFYMAIEGMCGWHSNHSAEVPWIQQTASTDVYSKEQVLLAMKLAGILAVTFNALGTEMDLPFGGYGVLGVCNDTAALVDFAVRGETNMHPLISTGRYLMHTGRRLIRLYENIHDLKKDDSTLEDGILRLFSACCNIQTDLLASPSTLIGSAKRFLAGQPDIPAFEIEVASRTIMGDLLSLFERYDDELDSHNVSRISIVTRKFLSKALRK